VPTEPDQSFAYFHVCGDWRDRDSVTDELANISKNLNIPSIKDQIEVM